MTVIYVFRPFLQEKSENRSHSVDFSSFYSLILKQSKLINEFLPHSHLAEFPQSFRIFRTLCPVDLDWSDLAIVQVLTTRN